MKPVREIVSREVIDDLWGAGYTILPRNRHPDPFFVPPEMVPQGRSYQWWHLVHDKFHFERPRGNSSGWAPVPANRHDGYFMPAGFVGDIEVNGLGLFEKSKFEVDQEKVAQVAAAHKQVDDWKAKWGGEFSGEVSVGGERTEVGDIDTAALLKSSYETYAARADKGGMYADQVAKTIENTTEIPRDMVPYIAQIFEERDRIMLQEYSDYSMAEIDKPYIHTKPEAMLIAIENVRKRIIEEAKNAQAS